MDARIGDKKQKDKSLEIVRDAGLDVKITLGGAHIQAFDNDVLVLAIMRVKAGTWAFRYNREYWNGL